MKFRSLCYLGTSVTLLCLLAACAPAPLHLDAEEMPMDPDLGALPAATGILPRPDPRPGFDCNDNDIEDAFDIAGLIPHGPYAVGHDPFYLTASDLDNNGAADIAVSNHADGTVTILWQHHRERRFGSRSTIRLNQPPANDTPPNPTCIDAGDIDGDGNVDLVVAPNHSLHRYVILLRNKGKNDNGDVEFELQTLQTPEASREHPRCVTVADVDNDGNEDIVALSGQISSPSAEHIVLFRNPGSGAFTSDSREIFETSIINLWDVTTANLDPNSDDYSEVIVKGQYTVGFLKNDTSTIRPLAEWALDLYSSESYIAAIALANVVSDDGEDLIVLEVNGTLRVLRNRNGVFSAHQDDADYEVHVRDRADCIYLGENAMGSGGGCIGTGDINNDGDIDIIIPDPSNNSVVLLRNRDNQDLLPVQHLPVFGAPTGIHVGNLDADNRLEIVVSNVGTDDVWVLHRRPEPVSRDRNGNGVPDSCEPPPGFGDTTP